MAARKGVTPATNTTAAAPTPAANVAPRARALGASPSGSPAAKRANTHHTAYRKKKISRNEAYVNSAHACSTMNSPAIAPLRSALRMDLLSPKRTTYSAANGIHWLLAMLNCPSAA